MYLVLSGEGKTDIGHCNNQASSCEYDDFTPRAMTIIIDQIIDQWFYNNRNYEPSCLSNKQITYISENYLQSIRLPKEKKISLSGKKSPKETKYFYENARSLASFAKEKQKELDSNGNSIRVIAVLFRDSDGTASSKRGEYQFKRASMKNGFEKEGFFYGVVMIPNPKSEAWLLCATKDNPYIGCSRLENASGNDNSSDPLKAQLDNAMSKFPNGPTIEELLIDKKIDINKIDMPSFNEFRNELEHVLSTF